ncbi:GGDEF domain-containing protein [Aliivibrio sp. S4TY2]|uniref:GGDEF domain-containing protein n=1 Tax=unclassified Aliivibrio TaxID=2645654 RepID=UPI002379F132|nr:MULTISPECIES: GGDEF domain-containing protein [unclassified Aliivibrio]MDD9155492.1 GGDEF domain-containing protein [Aliivibrio sp. S4TY2]MDD9160359.1 GGDEF domain-containing protein [Aliivibrio sp. S4TY1]MDD9164743.1 GGDEF domain-containing protein [Aliivibrio sp. S4MY2]MDD9168549.1 GGDEF domain-containing protein [Aliivibrio sp. S4MY4]MDD9185077.1 GGDEF domain-containing protein [Aliivibrio sp. S4MY3]
MITISPEQYQYYAADDKKVGGISEAVLAEKNGKPSMHCTMKKGKYAWPYCEVAIHFSDSIFEGIDLSLYSKLILDIDYKSADPNGRLRVYLRNSNPIYTKRNDAASLKFNGIEYEPGFNAGPKEIALADFQVMTWWIADYKVSVEHAAPEFSNVSIIEIATSSTVKSGEFEITINSIELRGSWIKENTLLKIILYAWLVIIIAYILYEQKRLNRSLKASAYREGRLRKLNDTLKEKNVEFAELAHRDSLTGARNRNAVRDWLDQMSQQVRWGKQAFSVIYIDIDYFKKINDKLGHQIGDDILREFVLVVTSAIKNTDFLVRWGGEEFIVFCPNHNAQQATEKAEHIRRIVEHHLWCHNESLTCSLGIAEMKDERISEVIARADDALYKAKNAGRNQVVTSANVMNAGESICFRI